MMITGDARQNGNEIRELMRQASAGGGSALIIVSASITCFAHLGMNNRVGLLN